VKPAYYVENNKPQLGSWVEITDNSGQLSLDGGVFSLGYWSISGRDFKFKLIAVGKFPANVGSSVEENRFMLSVYRKIDGEFTGSYVFANFIR
jgi:hypothetical protein